MEKRAGKLLGIVTLIGIAVSSQAIADTISFGGVITQSTSDGTGPAVNNPALNNIQDGDNFLINLTFTGSITAPGTYPLAGASLLFSDTDASVTESSFSSVSLSVTADGASDDLSLLGCLSTGSNCAVGNQLDANFKIAAASLNAQNVPAQSIFQITPLDLLEDDGVTDIQGSISSYSYAGSGSTSPTPEPSQVISLGVGLAALLVARHKLRGRV